MGGGGSNLALDWIVSGVVLFDCLFLNCRHLLCFQGKHEFDPETEDALLLGEDFDEEEEEEDGRSWKR